MGMAVLDRGRVWKVCMGKCSILCWKTPVRFTLWGIRATTVRWHASLLSSSTTNGNFQVTVVTVNPTIAFVKGVLSTRQASIDRKPPWPSADIVITVVGHIFWYWEYVAIMVPCAHADERAAM